MKLNKTKLIIIVTTLLLSSATQNLHASFWNDNNQNISTETIKLSEKQTPPIKDESDNSLSNYSGGGFFNSENNINQENNHNSGNNSTINRISPNMNGDSQKMPISDEIWILMGLVVIYGFVKWKKHRNWIE